jgi:hypothetical protein
VILFVLMVGIPLGALGWAAIRTLHQDRDREARELQERLDNAAAAEVDRGLLGWEERLAASAVDERAIPPGAAVLLFDAEGVVGRLAQRFPTIRRSPQRLDRPRKSSRKRKPGNCATGISPKRRRFTASWPGLAIPVCGPARY